LKGLRFVQCLGFRVEGVARPFSDSNNASGFRLKGLG
jgi:hypothetical protein